jgi:2Fe-2S ferredoxin
LQRCGTPRKIARSLHRHAAPQHPFRFVQESGMAELVIVDRDGKEHRVAGKVGVSVMETLRELDYGVAAICGGMCSCATCHVYVDPAFADKLPAKQGDEQELLQELSGYKPTSRLSCQVQFTEALDGLKVAIAPDE